MLPGQARRRVAQTFGRFAASYWVRDDDRSRNDPEDFRMRSILSILFTAALLAPAACLARDIEPTVENDTLKFELPNLNGGRMASDDEELDGKVILVDIWGTWCPPCRESIPNLVKLQEEYRDEGLLVIGIAFESEEDTELRRDALREFVKEFEINYPVLDGGLTSDRAESLPTLKGFQGYPTMIIVGRDGKVAHANTVFVPREEKKIREEVIRALEAETKE